MAMATALRLEETRRPRTAWGDASASTRRLSPGETSDSPRSPPRQDPLPRAKKPGPAPTEAELHLLAAETAAQLHREREMAAFIAGRSRAASSTAKAQRKAALRLLEDFYRTSQEAPEAFRAEYEATTAHVLRILQVTEPEELEAGSCGGQNALHCAAGCGCLEVCEYLLKHSPRLNFQQDSHGHTPLLWAVRHGLFGAAQLLLRHGAVAQHADRRGLTALHWAAALGYPRLCRLLLAAPRLPEQEVGNCRDSRGWSPLHSAAYGGSADCCQALVEASADVDLRTPEEDWTPLHLAAVRGNAKALEVLIPRASAEVLLALDLEGRSAKELAEEAGQKAAAQVLQDPEEAHQRLVCKWAKMLDGGPEVKINELLNAAIVLQAPDVERIGKSAVELSCHVTDLEFRITGYVMEVRRSDGPDGAAPARVYYARASEQRKLERVQFLVPRLRSNGLPVWEVGGTYQFRVTGCCERAPQQLMLPRQVSSSWSMQANLTQRKSKQSRNGSCEPHTRHTKRLPSRTKWPPASIAF